MPTVNNSGPLIRDADSFLHSWWDPIKNSAKENGEAVFARLSQGGVAATSSLRELGKAIPIRQIVSTTANGITLAVAHAVSPFLSIGGHLRYNCIGVKSNLKETELAASSKLAERITDLLIMPMLGIENFCYRKVISATVRWRLGRAIELISKSAVGNSDNEGGSEDDEVSTVNRALHNLLSFAKTRLEGNEDRFLQSAAKYEQYTLLVDALKLVRVEKVNQPGISFEQLREKVYASFTPAEKDNFSIALKDFVGPSIAEKNQLEYFFNCDIKKKLNEIDVKKAEILNNTFQPLSVEILKLSGLDDPGDWGLLPRVNFTSLLPEIRDNRLPEFFLESYSQLAKGAAAEADFINQLARLLYRGYSFKNEIVAFPDNGATKALQQSQVWNEALWQQSGVKGAAQFINNTLSVFGDEIVTRLIQDTLKSESIDKLGEDFAALRKILATNTEIHFCFDLMGQQIKAGMMKLLANVGEREIDDIRQKPTGNRSAALPANILVNLSKIWIKHKDIIALQLEAYKQLPWTTSEGAKKVFYIDIFRELSDDLVRLGGINPLEDLPFLTKSTKKELWDEVQKEHFPILIGQIYESLIKWEMERYDNEFKLSAHSEFAVDAMSIFSRYAVEATQNYFGAKPEAFGEQFKDFLSDLYKDSSIPAGAEARSYLAQHEIGFQNVTSESLQILAKDDDFWKVVENALQPVFIKLSGDFLNKLESIEAKEHSLFFRNFVYKIFERFATHQRNINAVTSKVGKNSSLQVDKQQMLDGLAAIGAGKKGILQNPKYVAAKKKVLLVEAKVNQLNGMAVKAAQSYQNASQFFGIKEGWLSRKADGAIKTLKNAREELKKARNELNFQRNRYFVTPLTLKILAMIGLHSSKDLPLPESSQEWVWEQLITIIVPAILENLVKTLTSQDMLNKALLSPLKEFNKAKEKFQKTDPIDKTILTRLRTIAKSQLHDVKRKVAEKILAAIKRGLTLEMAVAEVMAANPDALDPMRIEMGKGAGLQREVRIKWNKLVRTSTLAAELRIQGFDAQHGDSFEAHIGELVKEMVNMIPYLKHINLFKIQWLRESTAETVGISVRDTLKDWTVKKAFNVGIESAALSLLPRGHWADENGRKVYKVIPYHAKEGYSKDFRLPITPKAKNEWDIANNREIEMTQKNTKNNLVDMIGYLARGFFESKVKSALDSLLEVMTSLIDRCFRDRNPHLKDSINEFISKCLDKDNLFFHVLMKILIYVMFPLWFPFELVFVQRTAGRIMEGLHMQDVHEDFAWDSIEIFVDQFTEKLKEVVVR